LDPVKSSAEAQVDHNAIQAARVETEDPDGDFASLRIEITPRFQVKSCVTDPDWTRRGPGLWQNKELGELETCDITDAGVDETDEWRRAVGHLNVSNDLPGLGLQLRARTGQRLRE
jgi:hypothetical protein